ncbi:MAG: response regulator [Pelobium sp.]
MKSNNSNPKTVPNVKEFKLSEEKLKAIFDSAFDEYYILISPEFQTLFFNENSKQAFKNMSNIVLEVGKDIRDYIAIEHKKEFTASINKCLNGNSFIKEIEFFSIALNNSVWLEFHYNLVYVAQDLFGISIIIRDISKKKNNEFALINKNKTLHEYAFLTSHKLRAPLSNILGLSNLIEDMDEEVADDYSKVKSLFKNIQFQAETLDNIIHILSKLISDSQKMEFNTEDYNQEIKRIVLVDDEPIVTMLNSRMIEKVNKNIEKLSFNNPFDALKYLEKNKADLILLDINMPEMDAWDFLNNMKNMLLTNNVIIVSSSIDPNDRKKASGFMNVKGFLNKPLRVEDLKLFLSE